VSGILSQMPQGVLSQQMGISPQDQGLLALGLGLMANSGPSRMPTTFGQNFGQAGMGALGVYGKAVDNQQEHMARAQALQMKQQEFDLLKQQRDATLAEQQRTLAAQRQFAGSLTPEQRLAFDANPTAFMQSHFKAQEPYSQRPGERRMVGTTVISENPVEAKPPKTEKDATGVLRYTEGPQAGQVVPGFGTMAAPPGFTRGTDGQLKIDPGFLAGRKEIAAAGAARISNTPIFKQEGEESKAVGKHFGETYAQIQTGGFNAGNRINRLSRLSQLLEGVQTGKLTPLGTDLASYASSIGLNVDAKLGNKQAADALANEIALELRSTGDGGGMPGAMSDQDRNFLKSMVPGLATSPQGRKMMIETSMKIERRKQDVAKLAREYRKKHGSLNDGFYEELQAFSDKNPLFPAPKAAAPTGGKSVLDEADAIIRGGR
jgi:hypothetical protein